MDEETNKIKDRRLDGYLIKGRTEGSAKGRTDGWKDRRKNGSVDTASPMWSRGVALRM